ncbi:hypothetical protein ACFL27_18260 [candidate division CSSED10-310 bacterium]|uniref:TMhelix containing protein n=1 Tax=candidate division CSSED10-310 bacterium TaxID=2855610 RepID=A0ABV6Z110_UNCC1
MNLIILKIMALVGGITTVFAGVWAGFEAKKPFNIIGAICAPLGLVIALLAVLLLCVPDFFK